MMTKFMDSSSSQVQGADKKRDESIRAVAYTHIRVSLPKIRFAT
jgi:hypothetical protein